MTSAEDVVRQINEVRFTPTRLRDGYAMDEVDAFLDELVRVAGAGKPLGPTIDGRAFTVVSLREGYHTGEVDAFLARLSGRPVPVATGSEAASVIQEQRGWWSRLFGRR